MPKRGLLIFDLDGTLFQVDRVSIPAVQRAMKEGGFTPPAREEIQQFFGRPDPEFHAWLRERHDGIPEAVIAAIPAWELRLIPETGALYPGVLEALAELRAIAAHMAICSNGYGSYVEAVVGSQGLAPFFDAVRWREEGDGGKVEMVAELLARFPSRPAVVIGDRRDDITAAHANGALAVACRYGFGKPEELAAADAAVSGPSEWRRVIEQVLRPT